jgi:3-deoxy-D-manno-octulosonate 8-phosphate phosphatase (KDO 8-P phosphatase)
MKHADLAAKARRIKLLLTDCDGVLTDGGVYYGESGEVLKRFNIRDGMGVERLRAVGVDTGIVTGERSPSVSKRAEKLKINELHLGIKDKATLLGEILTRTGFVAEQVAFIGDDTNDVEILGLVGLAACPGDATVFARDAADYHCQAYGGQGAFRELAELIISCKGGKAPDEEGSE